MADKCLVCGGEQFESSTADDRVEVKFCINCGYRLGTTPEEEAFEAFTDDLDSNNKSKH